MFQRLCLGLVLCAVWVSAASAQFIEDSVRRYHELQQNIEQLRRPLNSAQEINNSTKARMVQSGETVQAYKLALEELGKLSAAKNNAAADVDLLTKSCSVHQTALDKEQAKDPQDTNEIAKKSLALSQEKEKLEQAKSNVELADLNLKLSENAIRSQFGLKDALLDVVTLLQLNLKDAEREQHKIMKEHLLASQLANSTAGEIEKLVDESRKLIPAVKEVERDSLLLELRDEMKALRDENDQLLNNQKELRDHFDTMFGALNKDVTKIYHKLNALDKFIREDQATALSELKFAREKDAKSCADILETLQSVLEDGAADAETVKAVQSKIDELIKVSKSKPQVKVEYESAPPIVYGQPGDPPAPPGPYGQQRSYKGGSAQPRCYFDAYGNKRCNSGQQYRRQGLGLGLFPRFRN